MNRKWLFIALVLTGVMALANQYGYQHNLYTPTSWYDIPMHLLGGASISAFIIGITGKYRPWVFWGGLISVAIGWEIFEFVFNISTQRPGYWFDTIHDVVNDGIGGLCIRYISRRV